MFRRRVRHGQGDRRGAAMIEMLLVLPLVVIVIALLFFFGRGMVRVQKVNLAARYEAWRSVRDAPGHFGDSADGHPQANDVFFGGRATSLSYGPHGGFPDGAEQLLVSAANDITADGGDLAFAEMRVLPGGVGARVSARHDEEGIWDRLDEPVTRRHIRIGRDWAMFNGHSDAIGDWSQGGLRTSVLGPVRNAFFVPLDEPLGTLASSGNGLASSIRGIYLAQPGYRGPTVE